MRRVTGADGAWAVLRSRHEVAVNKAHSSIVPIIGVAVLFIGGDSVEW